MFAAGLFDHAGDDGPTTTTPHASDARAVAEQAVVVLRNERTWLPLVAGPDAASR